VTTIEEMETLSWRNAWTLYLNSKAVMPEKVVKDLKNIYSLGKAKF